MPTYEYVCSKCDHHFEKFQSITDDALKVCPKELCGMKKWGKGKVKRAIVSGAGLIFKGTGFYETDYRSESYKADAKKDISSSRGDSKAGGDSKPSGESKSSGETKAVTPKTEAKAAKPKATS
jgi:putative FmdB family regulatory protein